MSLFGAINTAVSGLSAQSTAFGNISEDVANSQTVGFKRVDTSFKDYLTTSTPTNNVPGSVVAQPVYVNNVQGTVTQTDNPLSMAIAGQGFFAVSQPIGQSNGVTTYNPQQFYTRAGDFTMNSTGFLVNSAGQYLNGWSVNPATGVTNQNSLAPIQINQSTFNPVATTNVTLAANLPATPTPGTALPAVSAGLNATGGAQPAVAASPLSSQITVYDSLGTAHAATLNWTQVVTPVGGATPPSGTTAAITKNQWTVDVQVPNSAGVLTDVGSAVVTFASTSGTAPPAGTIESIVPATGSPSLTGGGSYNTGTSTQTAATLGFTNDFGSGSQTINLNLGSYGGTSGVTQFSGTAYSLLGLTQDGVAPGSFSGVTTQANGNVVVNYNNGQTQTIAQVPVVTFNAPDGLQGQNGQSFTATPSSGSPLAQPASSNGAGNLVVGSVEGSNVDIATEFTSLIVTQQAYSSNAKVITTANQMLQATLQMIA